MPITRDRLHALLDTVPDDRLDEAGAALAIEARPDPSSPSFVDAVDALARRYGAGVGRLADALA